jgi:GntR family transcriptional regulator
MTGPLPPGTPTFAPLYKEVKRFLTDGLAQGEWQAGAALPSETQLARRYQVSIGTIRKAVDELVAERVLVRQQGRGTFVATHDTARLMFQFFRLARADGAKAVPDVALIGFDRGKAEPDEARRLGLLPGERVYRVANLLSLAGEPVAVDDIVLPQALFPDLTEKAFRERDDTIYSFYQTRYGINVVRAVERLRARTADRAAAKHLRVAVGAPLLEINRTALSYHSSPVELRRSLVNTAQHEYLSDVGKAQGA